MSYPYGYEPGSWPHHDPYYYGGSSSGGRSGGRGRGPPPERGGGGYYDQMSGSQYGSSSTYGSGYLDSKGRDPHRDSRDFYYGVNSGDYDYDRRRVSSGPSFDSTPGGRSNYRGGPPPSGHYESRSGPASSSYQSDRSNYYSYNGGQQYFYGNSGGGSNSFSSSSHSFYSNNNSYYHDNQYSSSSGSWQQVGSSSHLGSDRSALRSKTKLTDSPTKLRQYSFGSNKRKILAGSRFDVVKSTSEVKKSVGVVGSVADATDKVEEQEVVLKEPDKIKDPAIERMVKLSSSILDHKLSLILLALNLKVGDSNSKENNAPQVNINTATGSAVPLSSSTNVTEAKPSNVFPETPRVVRQEKPPALTPVLQGKPDLPAENNKTSTPALKRSISDASTSSTAKKPRPSRPPALTDPNNIAGGAETQRSYADPPRLKPPSKVNDVQDSNSLHGNDTPSRRISDSATPHKSYDQHNITDRGGDSARRYGGPAPARESWTPRDIPKDSLRDATPRNSAISRDLREPFRGDSGRDLSPSSRGMDMSRDIPRDHRDIGRDTPRERESRFDRDFPPAREIPRDGRDIRDSRDIREPHRSGGSGHRDHDYYHHHDAFHPPTSTNGDNQYDYYHGRPSSSSQHSSSHWGSGGNSYDNNPEYNRGGRTPSSQTHSHHHSSGSGGGTAHADRYSYSNYPPYNDYYGPPSASDRGGGGSGGYFRGNDFSRGPPPSASSPAEFRNSSVQKQQCSHERDFWGSEGQRLPPGKQSGHPGSARKGPPPLRTPR